MIRDYLSSNVKISAIRTAFSLHPFLESFKFDSENIRSQLRYFDEKSTEYGITDPHECYRTLEEKLLTTKEIAEYGLSVEKSERNYQSLINHLIKRYGHLSLAILPKPERNSMTRRQLAYFSK